MSTRHPAPAQSRLLITGLIRDGAASIAREIDRLVAVASGFLDVRLLVVESDSSDATPAALERLAVRLPGLRPLALGRLADRFERRSDRLAHCRNAGLDEVARNPAYADIDYILVADLDGMNDLLTRSALESCWTLQAPWSVLTANQAGPYYDIWALRHPDWCPIDCWQQLRRLEPLVGHAAASDIAIHGRQIRLDPACKPVEVQSAFGGLALYTRAAFLAGGYEGTDDAGEECCEHVAHHRRIAEAGHRLFINPRLINTGATEHTRHKRAGKVIRAALKDAFRSG